MAEEFLLVSNIIMIWILAYSEKEPRHENPRKLFLRKEDKCVPTKPALRRADWN